MATAEIEAIAQHVQASAKAHGTTMRFLKSGPRAYRHRPAMYVEGSDNRTRRTLHMDHVARPDGYRQEGVHARQRHVPNAVENGLPTRAMLDAVDAFMAWRVFEERRRALLEARGEDDPDWSRTIHVLHLAALGREGVERRITGKGDAFSEHSGYIHGRSDITEGVTFSCILDHGNQIVLRGEIAETVRLELIGNPLQHLLGIPALASCAPVPILDIQQFGGSDGPAPMMMVMLADVRAMLAPVPTDVDARLLLPPGSIFPAFDR